MENKYHIKISVKLLFNTKEIFKSNYTKWVYVYLKLKDNYFIQHKIDKFRIIDAKEIAKIFNINRATVFDCLAELVKNELITKRGRGEYRVNSETEFVKKLKDTEDTNDTENSKEPFLPIFNNSFISLLKNGADAKDLEVYYYLINSDSHHLMDEEFVKVEVSSRRACRDLRMGYRKYTRCIIHLLELGCFALDSSHYLLTRFNKNGEPFVPVPDEDETTDDQCQADDNIKEWIISNNGQSKIPVLDKPGIFRFVDFEHKIPING